MRASMMNCPMMPEAFCQEIAFSGTPARLPASSMSWMVLLMVLGSLRITAAFSTTPLSTSPGA